MHGAYCRDGEAPRCRYTDSTLHNVVALAPRATIVASALNRFTKRQEESDFLKAKNAKGPAYFYAGPLD